MVHPCIVSGCKNKAKDGIYRFPRDLELRRKWLESINCNEEWNPDDETQLASSEGYRICGLHFKSEDFKRDLKGELLGVPSKRKVLLPGAIPSTEKQERTRSNTKSKQRSRPNNTSNALSSNTLYQEISTESPMDSYHTPLLIVRDNTKKSLNSDSAKTVIASNLSRGKRVSQEKRLLQKSKRINSTNLSFITGGHDFDIEKSNIIAKIKKEAEENVLKEKVLATLKFPLSTVEPGTEGEISGKVRRLPPQPCVILKPVSNSASSDSSKNEDEHKEPPPIIIPGNPEKSIRLLKDKKGIDLIEKEIEKHSEQKISTSVSADQEVGDPNSKEGEENATAIILTSLTSLHETTHGKSKDENCINEKDITTVGNLNIKSLPPLRMKPEPNTQQKVSFTSSQRSPAKSLIPHPQIQSRSQSIASRKCTVLDLLFDREDTFEDSLSNPLENIPSPEPVPDDSRLSVIVFKNNKIASLNEPFSEEGSTDTTANKNAKSANNKNVKYAIFDPSGLKSELDKYKEEVKKLRKENYGLKIKNQSLRNEKNKLSKKVEIREKLMETRRRKSKKDMETIAKLRTELSKLRQLRNKMRRREYNRKAKHEKVLERRKKRRQFIQEQIDLGHMDKSQLSLVYSRKKLPYERKPTNIGLHHSQEKEKKSQIRSSDKTDELQVPISMSIVEQQSNSNLFPTPTVEYIIEHEGQIDDSHVEGETVIQVENYYENLETENAVTEQETNEAVAGISNCNFQPNVESKEADSESFEVVSSSYDSSYVSVAHEHRYTAPSTSHKQDSRTVKIIRLQNPITRGVHSHSTMKTNVEECSADNLDYIVKAVNELENSNSVRFATSTMQANIKTLPSNISNLSSTSIKQRPATFVILPPSSTPEQKK